MRNQATKMNKNQLALFSGGEAVEDLLYEFLKNRSPLTERAYRRDLKAFFEFTATQFGLPRSMRNKLLFGEIRRVHVVKYKKYLDKHVSKRKRSTHPIRSIAKSQRYQVSFNFYYNERSSKRIRLSSAPDLSRIVLEETQAFSDREMKTFFDSGYRKSAAAP